MAKWGALSDLEPREYEVRLRRSDGVFRWFLFRIEPLRDEVREVVRWYGTATDKTAGAMPKGNDCWSCHEQHATVEHTFVQFYPTLKPVAKAFGTYNEARDQVR
jgi:hypothetical protein